MRYAMLCANLLGIALLLVVSAGSAQAQATRTWVSGVGDDANPCSRTAPCKTLAGSISKTAPGGEINMLDPGGVGAVTITKSITIISEGFEAGVLVSGTNGIVINAGANDVITLKGLDIEGLGTGLNGITFLAGSALHVVNCSVRRFSNNGISFTPSSGATELYVVDSRFTENGNAPTVAGVLVRPTGTASVMVSINRSQFENNTAGVRIDTAAPGGIVKGVVRDTLVAGHTNNGITAIAGASAATLLVDQSSVVGNTNGLVVNGAGATLLANQTSITGNTKALLLNPSGTLSSYKNNAVNGNTDDGAFTNFITPQ